MASDLMYGLIGAGINAIGTMFGTPIDKLSGGLYSKAAGSIPFNLPIEQGMFGLPFISKIDELLLLGDAAAAGYGLVSKKKNMLYAGLGGVAGWVISKKFLGGQF